MELAAADHDAVAQSLTAAARAWRRATPLAESFALNDLERRPDVPPRGVVVPAPGHHAQRSAVVRPRAATTRQATPASTTSTTVTDTEALSACAGLAPCA